MDFSGAMAVVLNGGLVCRRDWTRPRYIVKIVVEMGSPNQYVEQIVMVMKDGKMNAYTPSQCDMLAYDWFTSVRSIS